MPAHKSAVKPKPKSAPAPIAAKKAPAKPPMKAAKKPLVPAKPLLKKPTPPHKAETKVVKAEPMKPLSKAELERLKKAGKLPSQDPKQIAAVLKGMKKPLGKPTNGAQTPADPNAPQKEDPDSP